MADPERSTGIRGAAASSGVLRFARQQRRGRSYDTGSIATQGHIALIYNPFAGRIRRRPELLQSVVDKLADLGTVRAVQTSGPGTAGALAKKEIESGARMVVVFGGDGTVNEVANGMIHSPVPIAALPGGTANVLCLEIGTGTDPLRAAARLAHEYEPVPVAIGRMRRHDGHVRHFLLMAGVGLDAMVLDHVNPALKARTGKFAYWVGGFSVLTQNLPQFVADTGGSPTNRSFALACRVRNYGGDLEIARRVTLLDPCFETVLFEGKHSVRYLSYMAGILAKRVEAIPGAHVAAATRMVCAPANGDRIPVQLDGEPAGFLPADFDLLPDALTLMLPSAYVQRARQNRWITSPTP